MSQQKSKKQDDKDLEDLPVDLTFCFQSQVILQEELKKIEYIGTYRYEDEYGNIQKRYFLNIYIDMLTTKDDWIKAHMDEYNISYEECEQAEWELYVFGDEFNDNQKNFIKLAFDCGVESISLW